MNPSYNIHNPARYEDESKAAYSLRRAASARILKIATHKVPVNPSTHRYHMIIQDGQAPRPARLGK